MRSRFAPLVALAALVAGALPAAAPPAGAAARHRQVILFSPEGNRLRAYDLLHPKRSQVVIPSHADDPKHGLDINAQICFKPGTHRFIAGEDTNQDKGRLQGWSYFQLRGRRVGDLTAKRIGRLAPTYQQYASPDTVNDNYGCAFLPDGRLFTTDIGDRYPGLPGDGQLIVWFPPFDTKHVHYCKIDVQLPTPGGIYIDKQQRVYVATNRAGEGSDPHDAGIYRYSAPFPTSDTPEGGCEGTDSTGAPMTSSVQRELFIPADENITTPSAVTRSPSGTFYISSVFNGVIAEYTRDGTFIRRVLEPPPGETLPYSSGTPYGLAVGPDGTLYYADLGVSAGPPPDAEAGAGSVRRIPFHSGEPGAPVTIKGHLDYPDGLGILRIPGRRVRTDVVTAPASSDATVRLGPAAGTATAPAKRRPKLTWPVFGRTQQRSFNGRTSLTPSTVQTLQQRWFVPTDDAVTATPIVANGKVYVGSWDGFFRAASLTSGDLLWKFKIKPQPAVHPVPGQRGPQDIASDGGLITSTAAYVPKTRKHPALVIFGGGYTLYALQAGTGKLFWSHDYTGRPEKKPDPEHDPTRIFSSPAVVGNHVLFGTTNDGEDGYHGYFASANLLTGKPQWVFQTDVDANGNVANNGCNGVWSSPTIDRRHKLVFFDTSDCDATDRMPYSERVIALRYANGKKAWVFKPPRKDPGCDWDFGATPNFRYGKKGRASFLGVGGKDGTYYSIAPATGKLRWHTNVVAGGTSGGFIGSAAIDGKRVYGATAIGELGGGSCDPSNPNDTQLQEPSMHAFDMRTGEIVWQQEQAQSVSATTVAGGMTFTCTAFSQHLDIRDANTGTLLMTIPTGSGCNSGVVVAGNMVLFGQGEAENANRSGFALFTPNGEPPKP